VKVFYILWFFSPYNDIATMDHYDSYSDCMAVVRVITEKYAEVYPRMYTHDGKNWVDKSIECIKVEAME
jgi:glycine/serine hydroxymethyltransferase